MTHNPWLELVKQLCGSFSNEKQALDNPPLYGNILVRYRPIKHLEAGHLLLEQAYAIAPDEPYRVRVLRPWMCKERGLIILNYAIDEDKRFWGAIENEDLRLRIRKEDLKLLPGCTYLVKDMEGSFRGQVEPGCGCIVKRNGVTTYLMSEFTLTKTGMETIDRGHDPTTHEHLWGSVAGPFKFERNIDWSKEIPEDWKQFS